MLFFHLLFCIIFIVICVIRDKIVQFSCWLTALAVYGVFICNEDLKKIIKINVVFHYFIALLSALEMIFPKMAR